MINTRKSHRYKRIPLLFLIVFLIIFQYSTHTATAIPSQGDYFEYGLVRKVDNGNGAYTGYSDETKSSGKYEIQAVNDKSVRFHAFYSWTYENSEGLKQNGTIDRTAEFSLFSRYYTTPKTDLDEYDTYDSSSLAEWIWIPTNVKAGDSIKIVDDIATVTSTDSVVWSNWLPVKVIELSASGFGSRNDSYGSFTYTYTVLYYFDSSTGYIIAERYREEDTGSWQYNAATFEKTEDLDVTHSSYAITIAYQYLVEIILGITGSVLLVILLAFMLHKHRWRIRELKSNTHGSVHISRIFSSEKLPLVRNAATKYFEPFIEDFVNKALLAKDRVGIAVASGELLGFATYNSEAKIGMILCEHIEVKEPLRNYMGIEDFFSEINPAIPDKIINDAAQPIAKIEGLHAYKILDTYQIVRLDNIPDISYDTNMISRMKEADMPDVEKISRNIYGVRSKQWIRAQFLSGDIGFVSRIDGKIVGFAFATYANGHGRIHTLTVLPEYQNGGIGKELMRARLKMLHDLGASDVIAEIANWNLSSLQIAYLFGFKQVSMMRVETVREFPIKRTIMRR